MSRRITQDNLFTVLREYEDRIGRLERAVAQMSKSMGRSGLGRFLSASAGNAVGTGWSWSASSSPVPDSDFYQVATPPGGAATNSGIKILRDGVYQITASVLVQASVQTRYDCVLQILNSSGTVTSNVDTDLETYFGSSYLKFHVFGEVPITAGAYVFILNPAVSYGDSAGPYSNMTIRYTGAF